MRSKIFALFLCMACAVGADEVSEAKKRIMAVLQPNALTACRNKLNRQTVSVVREIMARRPETAELGQKYITALEKNDGAAMYRMNMDIQESFYSEKEFVRTVIKRNIASDWSAVISYEVQSKYLFGKGENAEKFRKDWLIAGRERFVPRIPNDACNEIRQWRGVSKLSGKQRCAVRNLIWKLETEELLPLQEYREAAGEYYQCWADKIRRENTLKESAPEYFAWVSAVRRNAYPKPDNPLTKAWNAVLANDKELKNIATRKKRATEKVIAILRLKIKENGKTVQEIDKVLK